jgi:hypothetical protein
MAGLMGYQHGRAVWQMSSEAAQFETRDDYLDWLEEGRVEAITTRKRYYAGEQYDEENQKCLDALAAAGLQVQGEEKAVIRAKEIWARKLPEHLRLHEYSTVIQEAIDFIANRLSDKFSIDLDDETAGKVIQAALDATPELAGTDDDDELTVANVMREAVKAGDAVAQLLWDPKRQSVWMRFWDSEAVDLRFADGRPDEIEKAIVTQVDWRVDPEDPLGGVKAMTVKRVWEVVDRVANQDALVAAFDRGEIPPVPAVRQECVESVYAVEAPGTAEQTADGKNDLRLLETIPWGVPFVPFWPIRSDRQTLRAVRGDSMITEQAMKGADRYNANEQVSWLIARYNSHASLVIVGDNALLMEQQSKRLNKDVADVLTFPGGTNALALSLPTDPQMIEHQRQVLLDGLYGTMGITRVDQTSLEGLGGVTGYALEILNQKSQGTFARVKKQLIRDWKKLMNKVLDCHTYWSVAPPDQLVGQLEFPGLPAEAEVSSFATLDPKTAFPNRKMTVNVGSGDIVDIAAIRDDYTAKLISQEEALRQRGKSEPEIKKIMDEQQASADQAMERQQQMFGQNTEGTGGSQGGQGGGQPPKRQAAPSSSQAGSSTRSTDRPRAGASA